MSNPTMQAQAYAFGFRVHESPEGGWYWTLTQDAWSGIEVGEGDHPTEAAAWDAAIIAHASELMEP